MTKIKDKLNCLYQRLLKMKNSIQLPKLSFRIIYSTVSYISITILLQTDDMLYGKRKVITFFEFYYSKLKKNMSVLCQTSIFTERKIFYSSK